MGMNGVNPAMGMNGVNPAMGMNGVNPAMGMNGMNPAMGMNGINPIGPNGMMNSMGQGNKALGLDKTCSQMAHTHGMRGGPPPPQQNMQMPPHPPIPNGPPQHGPGGPPMGQPHPMPQPPHPQPQPHPPPMIQPPYGGGGGGGGKMAGPLGGLKPDKGDKGPAGFGGKPMAFHGQTFWQSLDIEKLLSGSYVPLILVLLLAFVLKGR